MKSFAPSQVSTLLVLVTLFFGAQGFLAPHSQHTPAVTQGQKRTAFLYGFLGDKERDNLTRDSEPEEFFATNTDKMSDKDKIPIAIAGVAFITLPFIAGLIALYSAK